MTEQEQDRHVARRLALENARRTRGSILELAVRAEYLLGEALAHQLANEERGIAVLQEHMMWRVPIEVKLKLLTEVMDTYDISDTFPFVVPVLTRLFQVRNILAHSLEREVPDHPHEIGFLSVHRGRFTEHSIQMDALEWLWRQGNQVVIELALFSGAVGDFRIYENEESQAQDAQVEP